MSKVDFPRVIDNSIRSAFKSCERKGYYSYWENLAPQAISVDLHFGHCFHSAAERVRSSFLCEGENQSRAIEIGAAHAIKEWGEFEVEVKEKKNLPSLLDALQSYFEHWPLDKPPFIKRFPGGLPMLEKTFAIPIPGLFHPQHPKEPLLYGGRIDGVLEYENADFALDDKSSRTHFSNWAQHWHLAAQFTGYTWALNQLGFHIAGVIPRGVFIYDHDIGFDETVETRQRWEIDRWLKQLILDCKKMIAAWKSDYWDFDLSDACFAFNRPCSFMALCQAKNPEKFYHLFERRVWNPIATPEKEGKKK